MDGAVILVVSFILALVFRAPDEPAPEEVKAEVIKVNPRLNPQMTHDEHAFMRIANELGFH